MQEILTSQGKLLDPSELAIAFAIIKHRAPSLWKRLTLIFDGLGETSFLSGKSVLSQSVERSAAKKRTRKNISLASVDRYLYRYIMNGNHYHLEPVSTFLNVNRYKLEHLSNNIEIIKALGADLQEAEVTRWLLPNYRILKWLFSINSDDRNRRRTANHVANTFQLILVSYYSFTADDKKSVQGICQGLIYKFIRDELIGFDTSNVRVVKLLRDYTESESVEVNIVSLTSLCRGHLKLLAFTIRLMLQNERFEVVTGIIGFILKLLETLVICLVKLRDPSVIVQDRGKAYQDMYKERSTKISYKMVLEVLEASHSLGIQKATQRIEIALSFLMDLVVTLNLDPQTDDTQNFVDTFREFRPYLVSEFLMLNDSRLTAKFLRISWPDHNDQRVYTSR
ncbi:LANO_0B03246g1_1 [Lachancea nothofagi CBS 11611]|uniref:LANO_0B03246g1_1 n=1 Tax=Lachancea nothofagi CBS 11611 TaxID=1266666 RepID=A0A1G4IWR8_9SACH|nr:LANO_0B03246g1_1 [Lachancea nothofagi CBS 11611]